MYLELDTFFLSCLFKLSLAFYSLEKIQISSDLTSGHTLQDGIEPMWEDEKNKRGGRWLITLNKQQRRSDLDRFWLETVSTMALQVATWESCIHLLIL